MDINFKSKRHQRYKKYWDMFDNDPQFKRTRDKYIAIPLPAEVAKLYRDLSFRDPITPIVKDNEEASKAIDRLIFENDFNTLLSEASITQGVKGGVVIKNYLNDGKSEITFIQPEYYFPKLNPLNQREVISETIAVPVDEDDDRFLYTETYERKDGTYWCITKKHIFNNDELGAEVKEETKEVNTYLNQSPLTYVPFSRNNGDYFGYSLFAGMESLFEEYNWRVSQISKILDAHSNPSIVGSSALLDENYKFVKGESGLFIPVDENETKPSYLTWESQLKANFDYINDIIMKAIQFVTPLNSSLYGLSKESANSSALSIKLKAFRTSTTIETSLKYWERAIRKILYVAQEIDVLAGNKYKPALPNVEMSPSMPEDSYTNAQEEQLKIVAGATSIKSAIKRLNPHYTNKDVDDEFLEIINEENTREQMSFMKENEIDFDKVDVNEGIDE
jgi:hypothetical protein